MNADQYALDRLQAIAVRRGFERQVVNGQVQYFHRELRSVMVCEADEEMERLVDLLATMVPPEILAELQVLRESLPLAEQRVAEASAALAKVADLEEQLAKAQHERKVALLEVELYTKVLREAANGDWKRAFTILVETL
jgi:hypothetical protein